MQSCNFHILMCQSTPGAPTQRDLPQRLEPQIVAQPLGEQIHIFMQTIQIIKSFNGFLD